METPPTMPGGGDIPGALRLAILATIVYLGMPNIYVREKCENGVEILVGLELDVLKRFVQKQGLQELDCQDAHLHRLSKISTEGVYDCGVHGGVSVLVGSVATLAAKASAVALRLLSKMAADSWAYFLLPFGALNVVGGGLLLHFSNQNHLHGPLHKETTCRVKESMMNVISDVKITHLTHNAAVQNLNIACQDLRLQR